MAVARAIVTDPALILADEPTGNLDTHSGAEVMALLHELHRGGRTIVLITHEAEVASQATPPDPHPRRAGGGMKARDLIALALGRLTTSRLRTALTMLGVIIGVASVVALVSVGQGTTSNITDRLAGLGTNLLTVNPGLLAAGRPRSWAAGSASRSRSRTPRRSTTSPVLAGVAPEISTSQLVVAGDANTTTTIAGHDRGLPARAQLRALAGLGPHGPRRRPGAARRRHRVPPPPTTSASTPPSVGSEIKIGGLPFLVVGILQEKGGSGFQDPDDQVLIPVTTLQKYFSGSDAVRTIAVSATSADAHRRGQDGHHASACAASTSLAWPRTTTSRSSTRPSCWRRPPRSATR